MSSDGGRGRAGGGSMSSQEGVGEEQKEVAARGREDRVGRHDIGGLASAVGGGLVPADEVRGAPAHHGWLEGWRDPRGSL